ncbi:MAG: exodeoxyribonuclease subunit beta [Pseudomonadota bacterium]
MSISSGSSVAATVPSTLDPLRFPLSGSRLIEASAGTGKTWTIAALVVRLVLNHGDVHRFGVPLSPAEMLVMTFTRAATRELRDRIRARLVQASRCFRGDDSEQPDAFLQGLLADYPDAQDRTQAAWRLAQAADQMDEAAIHTIDAWCQRVLREHAFDSGALFELELLADESSLQADAARDYWRQHIVPLTADELAPVLTHWRSLRALEQELQQLLPLGVQAPQRLSQSLSLALARHQQEHTRTLQGLRQTWTQHLSTIEATVTHWLTAEKAQWNGRRLQIGRTQECLQKVRLWTQATDNTPLELSDSAWERFTPAGLSDARKDPQAAWTAPAWASDWADLRHTLEHLPSLSEVLREHAATHVHARLQWLKQRAGQLGFQDLQQRLYEALHGPNAEALRQRILQQYPIALIDEFQDTSPLQYAIFDRIYDTRHSGSDPAPHADDAPVPMRHTPHALLLIGDPKQSIYAFRGADIYSYIQARAATVGRHHVLDTNFRSTAPLVAIVNHCFAQAERQHPEGAFGYAQGTCASTDNPLPFVPVRAQGLSQQLVYADAQTWPALTLVHDLTPRKVDLHRRAFAQRAAERIVTWLNDPSMGFQAKGDAQNDSPSFTRLQPADIAVLVRTGQEAALVQKALRARGVASVYVSDKASVLLTDEARDLVHWLRAVAAPRDVRLVRAALATATFGLLDHELPQLTQDDEALDAYCEQFRHWQQVWHYQGVLALLRRSLYDRALPARWLSHMGGERILTNVLHLGELLQTAAHDLDGDIATLRWLEEARERALESGNHSPSEAQVLRLESDAGLVKIVTIHKSKGLQYPVVVLPFPWSCRRIEKRHTTALRLPPTAEAVQAVQSGAAVKLAFDQADIDTADQERLREDLRLFYVALTRACHALWVGFADATAHKKSITPHSAVGHLLAPASVLAQDWETRIQDFFAAVQDPTCLHIDTARDPIPTTPLRRVDPNLNTAMRQPPLYQGQFERAWGIHSFSSLGKHTSTSSTADTPNASTPSATAANEWGATALPSDPVGLHEPAQDEQELSLDPTHLPPARSDAAVWHRFARGAQAGNFLHAQLEWLAHARFDLNAPHRQTRLAEQAAQAGYEDKQADLLAWMQAICHHPLPGLHTSLSQVERVLPEMEFWLPAEHAPTTELDRICRRHWLPHQDRPTLSDSQVHGMLMGIADLVIEHEGQYWVLDYKSNHLGPDDASYTPHAIAASLAQHRYDAQAAIYLLALHRLLRSRLQDAYDPETQLGGAIYYYLRGLHGAAQGAYVLPASPDLLQDLDQWLKT